MIKRIFHKKANNQSSQQQQLTGNVKCGAADNTDQSIIASSQQQPSSGNAVQEIEPQIAFSGTVNNEEVKCKCFFLLRKKNWKKLDFHLIQLSYFYYF
jgi:hypothetical protein